MKVTKYNKLVRDNIPEIIAKSGKTFSIEQLNDDEYISMLRKKFLEEADEVNKATETEIIAELADVMEVVEAIENYYSINHNDVLNIKENKAKKNGKFEKRILLKEVIEK